MKNHDFAYRCDISLPNTHTFKTILSHPFKMVSMSTNTEFFLWCQWFHHGVEVTMEDNCYGVVVRIDF